MPRFVNLTNVSGIGLPGNLPDYIVPTYPYHPHSSSRPYVRVEICSSLIPRTDRPESVDPNDEHRWYRFAGGCAINEVGPQINNQTSGVLTYEDENGTQVVANGNSGLIQISARDSLAGQNGSVVLLVNDLTKILARLIRPMDRMRIIVIHPKCTNDKHQWLAYAKPFSQWKGSQSGTSGAGCGPRYAPAIRPSPPPDKPLCGSWL